MITRRDALKLGVAGTVASLANTSGSVSEKTNTPAAATRAYMPAIHQSDGPMDEMLGPFPFYRDGVGGFFDRSGNVVIEPRYQLSLLTSTRYFSEGLAVILLGQKLGCIDVSGQIQFLSEQFYGLLEFSNGLAAAWVEDSTWGYIDHSGAFVIDPQYRAYPNDVYPISHFSFHDGLAAVALNSSYGFIDPSGATIIPLKFADARPFSEGLAAVQDPMSRAWGYIDQEGEVAVGFEFGALSELSEGLAFETSESGYRVIDKAGNHVGNEMFRAWNGGFSEGLASVVPASRSSYGYVNTEGSIAIEAKYENCLPFSEGMGAIRVDGNWGFIDRDGNIMIEPQFKNAYPFSDGVALIVQSTGEDALAVEYGLVDKEGNVTLVKD